MSAADIVHAKIMPNARGPITTTAAGGPSGRRQTTAAKNFTDLLRSTKTVDV